MKLKTGFTMIEMTIVLIMIGILTAALAPLLMSQHTNNLEERDRVALTNAKNAIISYATTFGGIPDPQNADASGNPVGSVVGLMPPVTGGLNPVPALGVNNWGVFGSNTTNQFQMDVNDSLKLSCINALATGSTSCTPSATAPTTAVASGGNKVLFCQEVNAQLSLASTTSSTTADSTTSGPGNTLGLGGPRICQNTSSNRTGDTNDPICTVASTTVPTTSTPVAFVIFSTGNDRSANLANSNSGTQNVNTIFDRFYENDTRGINNSNDVPGHYDDQVMSYSLAELARDCRVKMNVLPEVMQCAPGQKYLNVTDLITTSGGNTLYYSLNVSSPSSVWTISSPNGCQASTTTISLCTNPSGQPVPTNGSPCASPNIPITVTATSVQPAVSTAPKMIEIDGYGNTSFPNGNGDGIAAIIAGPATSTAAGN